MDKEIVLLEQAAMQCLINKSVLLFYKPVKIYKTLNARQSNILTIVMRIKHWRYQLGLSTNHTY